MSNLKNILQAEGAPDKEGTKAHVARMILEYRRYVEEGTYTIAQMNLALHSLKLGASTHTVKEDVDQVNSWIDEAKTLGTFL
jgi:hypothetical protein